jgi:hypothetical protein
LRCVISSIEKGSSKIPSPRRASADFQSLLDDISHFSLLLTEAQAMVTKISALPPEAVVASVLRSLERAKTVLA